MISENKFGESLPVFSFLYQHGLLENRAPIQYKDDILPV